MAQTLKISKVNALPGTLEASTLYLVKSTDAELFEMYMSSADGLSARHVITKTEIQTLINTAVSGFSNLLVVADIAARNALTPTSNVQVIVLDASGDATVNSGAATYIFNHSLYSWYKISEYESMDFVLSWANLQNKPSSSVASIDASVAASHTHANKTSLDKISEDGGGKFLYNGQPVRAYLETEAW